MAPALVRLVIDLKCLCNYYIGMCINLHLPMQLLSGRQRREYHFTDGSASAAAKRFRLQEPRDHANYHSQPDQAQPADHHALKLISGKRPMKLLAAFYNLAADGRCLSLKDIWAAYPHLADEQARAHRCPLQSLRRKKFVSAMVRGKCHITSLGIEAAKRYDL